MILVGQMELAKRLEHPKKANFFQRIGTYCRIEKIPSNGAVKRPMLRPVCSAQEDQGRSLRKIPFMLCGNVRNMVCPA